MPVHDAKDQPFGLHIHKYCSVVRGSRRGEDTCDAHIHGIRAGEIEHIFRVAHQSISGLELQLLRRRRTEHAIAQTSQAGAARDLQPAELEILQRGAYDGKTSGRMFSEDWNSERQAGKYAGQQRIAGPGGAHYGNLMRGSMAP